MVIEALQVQSSLRTCEHAFQLAGKLVATLCLEFHQEVALCVVTA